MCTVSYIPTADGFILTSNRDESPLRPTHVPKEIKLDANNIILAPQDLARGGSWIATDKTERTACILNGAFKKHLRQLPYRMSRGKLLFDAFKGASFQNFAKTVVLDNIEPFTLLLFQDNKIILLVWDGNQKHLEYPDPEKWQLWSSVTLYTDKEHRAKNKWFKEQLRTYDPSPERLNLLHGLFTDTPFVLKLPHVKTISITQVVSKNNQIRLKYYAKDKNSTISTVGNLGS